MGFRAKRGGKKVRKVPKKMNVLDNKTSEQSEADVITLSSSEESNVNQSIEIVKRANNNKSDKILENNHHAAPRYARKCRYTGNYNANNWLQTSHNKKTMKLKDRLAEIEKLISQNKETGIILDYDENEARNFFEALGIRRICPSHM